MLLRLMKMTMMIKIIFIIMSSSPSLSLQSAAARSSELFRSTYIILHFGFATGAGLYEMANNTVICQN
jgi:hypothetical protein